MISQRPWWMYTVAASFLFLHLMEGYLVVWGPAFPQGLNATFERGRLRLHSIEAETVFSRAGLRAGDQILAVGGLRIQSPRDWTAAMANVQAEQPDTWTVLRG